MKFRLPITAFVPAAAAALLTGCSSTPEFVCTAIGAESGIAITVTPPLAQSAESAALEGSRGDADHDAQPEHHQHSDGADASGPTTFAGMENIPYGCRRV